MAKATQRARCPARPGTTPGSQTSTPGVPCPDPIPPPNRGLATPTGPGHAPPHQGSIFLKLRPCPVPGRLFLGALPLPTTPTPCRFNPSRLRPYQALVLPQPRPCPAQDSAPRQPVLLVPPLKQAPPPIRSRLRPQLAAVLLELHPTQSQF